MEVKTYTAYENIDRFSPVFLFNDSKKKKSYIYSSNDLTQLDNGNPTCIGVCINSPLKGQYGKVVIKGTINIRYFGDYPSNLTDVYIITKHKSKNVKGYVSYLCEEVTPLIYEKSHIIKVGTVQTSYHYNDKKMEKDHFGPRILNILLNIENKNYDHTSPHRLDLISTARLSGFTFSLYQIGQDLKIGMDAAGTQEKLQIIIDNMKQNSSKAQLYHSINNYCEQLFYNIPVVTREVASGYVKRLSVTLTSGQPVFDSENELRISSENSGSTLPPTTESEPVLTTIPLINNNPFNVGEFNLCDSISKSHLYPYINTTEDINSWVVGSLFLNPVVGMYDLVKTTINGVGYGVRYCPITESYNHTVSYFVGLTNTYNKYNSDGIIVRLSWYSNGALANSIYAIYNQYQSILQYYTSMTNYAAEISDNYSLIAEKTESVRVKGNQITAAISTQDTETVITRQNEIQVLYDEVEVLFSNSQNTIAAISATITLSTDIYNNAVDVNNNSNYAYSVLFYINEILTKHPIMVDQQVQSIETFNSSITARNNLIAYKNEADFKANEYLNNL